MAILELRAWSAGAPSDPRSVPWVLDDFDAERLLRRLCAEHSERELRALIIEAQLGAKLDLDTHELLATAAQLVARGQIRVFRTPRAIMTSDEVERSAYQPPDPVENEFEDTALLLPLIEEGPVHALEPVHQDRPPLILVAETQTLPPPTLIPLIEVLDAPIPVCVALEHG